MTNYFSPSSFLNKTSFKKIFNQQIRIKSDQFLSDLRSNHTKTKYLYSYKFQNYLSCSELSVEEKKLLFKLRTRTIRTKNNYKNLYKFDLTCSLCNDPNSEETDDHLLLCPVVIATLGTSEEFQTVEHKDIFGQLKNQVKVTKVYSEVLKILSQK